MSQKTLVTMGIIVGSTIGGYLPSLFGISMFSYTAILTSGIGAMLGIWVGYKLGE